MPKGHSRSPLETGEAKLWVLLVGVNRYQDERLPPLSYSASDCQGLEGAIAAATQAFPDKQVIVHHDYAAQAANSATETPTLEAVCTSLKRIVSSTQSKDTVLFYFSGHGELEPGSQQVFLCLADTQKDNLLSTGLGMSKLLQMLNHCHAHQQMVWLDACHSGGMTLKGVKGESATETFTNPTSKLLELLRQQAAQSQGFYAILSCDKDELSREFPELGYGLFTYYLRLGLLGEAADEQGVIDADGLYHYVYNQTRKYIERKNQQIRLFNQQQRTRGETKEQLEYPSQTPKRIVEGLGKLVLGTKPEGVNYQYPRQAFVVEGLANNKNALPLSQILVRDGGFKLEYWPRSDREWSGMALQAGIQAGLEFLSSWKNNEITTVLLYFRGRIQEKEDGEARLILGDGLWLNRSWLRRSLLRSATKQQILVLDCPGADSQQVRNWVDDLQFGSERGQCLIAAAAPSSEPEKFAEKLLETLKEADQRAGLSVAQWIMALQRSLEGTEITLHTWLSGIQGVIEVFPSRVRRRRDGNSQDGSDLGLCPYMGLEAFKEKDAQYFYGREALTLRLINQLNHHDVLAVVGASGSGKSSVVQAGLMTQLRQGKHLPGSEQWWVRSCKPGKHPLEELVKTLVDSSADEQRKLELEGMLHSGVELFVNWLRTRTQPKIVLIVDQFEELFTLTAPQERQEFLDLILGAVDRAAGRFKLVLTLRVDFMTTCLEVPALASILNNCSEFISPGLSEEDYRRAIAKPAEQVGLEVEEELVELLLQELSSSAGDLPLLQFVLTQLWEHRQGGKLTRRAYQQQILGLNGALERHANTVYNALDSKEQACVQWIFLTLTQLGEGTQDTRRRVIKSDLMVAKYPEDLVERTLGKLIAAKLIVTNVETENGSDGQSRDISPKSVNQELETLKREVTVEVVHEMLIRHWSILRWWLDCNRERLRLQLQLEHDAILWAESSQNPDFLWQGIRLAEATEKIYLNYKDELSQNAQLFIKICLQERERKDREKKARRLQRIGILTAFPIVIAIGGILFGLQEQRSQRNIEAVFLGADTTEIFNTLPSFLERADQYRHRVDKLGNTNDVNQAIAYYYNHEREIDRSFAYYRQILTVAGRLRQRNRENSQGLSNSQKETIDKIGTEAEDSLAYLIHKYRIPELQQFLMKPNPQFSEILRQSEKTDFANQYTEGALRTTYEILMRNSGAGADLNDDGFIGDQQEADQLPCETLKEIERLWRQATEQRCGWYGSKDVYTEYENPVCHELDINANTLTMSIFDQPVEWVVQRFDSCGISLNPSKKLQN